MLSIAVAQTMQVFVGVRLDSFYTKIQKIPVDLNYLKCILILLNYLKQNKISITLPRLGMVIMGNGVCRT